MFVKVASLNEAAKPQRRETAMSNQLERSGGNEREEISARKKRRTAGVATWRWRYGALEVG